MGAGWFTGIVLRMPNGIRIIIKDICSHFASALFATNAIDGPLALVDIHVYDLFVDGTGLPVVGSAIGAHDTSLGEFERCGVDFFVIAVDAIMYSGIGHGSSQGDHALCRSNYDRRRNRRRYTSTNGKLFVRQFFT